MQKSGLGVFGRQEYSSTDMKGSSLERDSQLLWSYDVIVTFLMK